MQKTIGIVVGVIVALAAGYYLFSNYLVSRLDGRGEVPAQSELQLYSSEEGLSFKYPVSYELSSRTEGSAERQWDVLVLLPKGYVPPQGGEGPPAITIGIFDNPEHLSLDAWIKGDARSNWKLAPDNAHLAQTTVGGEEALSYQHGGLYMQDAVAVMHNGKVYLFEGGWMNSDDQIRRDFANMLDTVQFN